MIVVHRVTFLSPGSFVSEQTSRPVLLWDIPAACEAATDVTERHGARPYGFYFTTYVTAPDVPDGMGGTLKVEARETERSGMHFLGGSILTVEDVERRADPKDAILLSNMRGNDMALVCEVRNGFRSTHPFGARDVTVNAKGEIVERGDTAERIAIRASLT